MAQFWTPLHIAAFYGKERVVDIFLDKINGNKNPKTRPGFLELGSVTPLDLATRYGYDGIIKKIKAAIKDDDCQFLCQTIKNESSQCIEPDLQEGL